MSRQPLRSRGFVAIPAILALVAACSGTTATPVPVVQPTPQVINATPQVINATPQVINATPQVITITPAPESAAPTTSAGVCTSADQAKADGKTPIEIDSWWTTGGESTGFNLLLDAFNTANPTLCAYNAAIAGGAGTVAQGRIKAAVLAGLPPDSFQVHMGHELLDTYVNIKGGSVMNPLGSDVLDPSKFPADVVKIISGTDGKVYSVPLNIHRANVLWYNKTVLTANGIANPPTTWAEFKTDADILKAAGITPIAVGDGGGIWPTGMLFETALIGELGADGFSGLWTGATKWDSPKVTAALNDLALIVGYEDAGAAGSETWDQAADDVISGKAAMTIMGDWANGEFQNKKFTDYGWAAAPGNTKIYQALADSFGLPAKATDQDATKKLLAYMATAEGQDIFNPYKGSIPARIDAGNPPATGAQYTDYQLSAIKDWTATDTLHVPSMEHGAAANPAWKSAIEDALTAFVAKADAAGVTAAQTALVDAASQFVTK